MPTLLCPQAPKPPIGNEPPSGDVSGVVRVRGKFDFKSVSNNCVCIFVMCCVGCVLCMCVCVCLFMCACACRTSELDNVCLACTVIIRAAFKGAGHSPLLG